MNKIYKKYRILLYFFSLIFILFIFFDLYITFSTQKYIFSDISLLKDYEFCLLLGTSKYTIKKSENLFYRYRIDAVKNLYDSSKIKKIILSGDSRVSSYDETKYMKKDLLSLKIPPEDLILDIDGFRTIYSIVNLSKKYNIDNALVVSQRFHLERAIFIGNVLGLKLNGFTAKPINGLSGLKILIRERGARARLLFDLLRYFLSNKKIKT
ncbi:MAG: ElyC/SanA/YdcF family protein [Spirochaetota bacterium]